MKVEIESMLEWTESMLTEKARETIVYCLGDHAIRVSAAATIAAPLTIEDIAAACWVLGPTAKGKELEALAMLGALRSHGHPSAGASAFAAVGYSRDDDAPTRFMGAFVVRRWLMGQSTVYDQPFLDRAENDYRCLLARLRKDISA